MRPMDDSRLRRLRREHPAWRLLAADSAPLVVSFLHRAFIEPNVRTLGETEIVGLLDDYLQRQPPASRVSPAGPHEYCRAAAPCAGGLV